MRLSRRLETLLSLSRGGECLADIGTDHGYAAVEGVRRGIFARALACDVRTGPLSRAEEHIRQAGLSGRIETRLGDGLHVLRPGEADTILIAGMGGPLMTRILEEGTETAHAAEELLLSPQSEAEKFRRYLLTHGYRIEDESALFEDEKYYQILRVRPGEEDLWNEEELLCGKILLERGDPALREQIRRETAVCEEIRLRLRETGSRKSRERAGEIEHRSALLERAAERMDRKIQEERG